MRISHLAPLALGAAIAFGATASLTKDAAASSKQTCHMKGLWNGNTADIFEFDAAYVYNSGEDDFSGIYTNPGISQANISASARHGTWNILLSYIDVKNRGAMKKLVGTGMQNPGTKVLTINGSYTYFAPNSGTPGGTGTFTISGVCH